jgi:hypothetical protein
MTHTPPLHELIGPQEVELLAGDDEHPLVSQESLVHTLPSSQLTGVDFCQQPFELLTQPTALPDSQDAPLHSFWHSATHLPPTQAVLPVHVLHCPPQPSSPHSLLSHCGTQALQTPSPA